MFTYENIKSFNDLELSVYDFVVEHQEQTQRMKIRELAAATHVSTTTIMNFCHKLGYDGFTEFKVRLKQSLSEDTDSPVNEDYGEVLDFMKRSSTPAFDAKIDAIAKAIIASEKTIFLGSSTSGIIAKFGARFLSSMGELSLLIDDPYYPTIGNLYDGAVIIVCSVSGETNDILDHLSRFKTKNCTIISITNTENSTIAKLADISIAYYITQARIGRYDITSQIPAVSIIERIGKRVHNLKHE